MDVVPALKKCLVASQLANHQLRERDQQMRLALDSLGGGRWEWDIAHQKLSCYGRFYAAFGMEAADSDDAWERWHARRHPADAARLADKMERAKRGQLATYEAEFRILDTAGRWRWVISRGLVGERDAAGRPLTLMGMDVDVTAQHEAQDALRAAETKYTTIYQTLPDAAGISRIADGRYIDVNPAFCALLGAEREDVLGRTSKELNIWASDQERTRMLETYRREGRVDRLPMVAHRDGVRVPGLMSARPVVVEGEDCFLFVFHDTTEAQRASDELRALNNLLQQAGRMARLGAWESTREAGMVYWSDVCCDIHGLPPGAPPPHDYVQRFVAPAWQEMVRAKLHDCHHHQTEWSLEHEIIRADGRQIWVRARGEPVLQDGTVAGMRGVLQDIDEAKRSEQRLRQSEDRFSRIFQLMPYPMGMTRQSDGCYVEVNPAWEQMLGYTRAQAVGVSPIQLGIFQAQDRIRLIDEARKTGQLDAYEVKIITRSGEERTALQSMRATEFDGEPCWLFAVHDITDRKRSEEQVREREALLSLTISAAALGLWDWDLQTGMVHGDARWCALRGAPTGDASAPPVHWTTGVAAEALAGISAELARHTDHPATPFDATWKVVLPQGGARWIRNVGKIIGPDDAGPPARMLGVAIDVTPQHEQQELLQKLAHYDALTGLPNRVLLAHRLQTGMAQARAHGTQLGVAYLDLDGFKPINDRLGHGAGDRLLVEIARRLEDSLLEHVLIARYGGDEFTLLPDGDCGHDRAVDIARSVLRLFEQPFEIAGQQVFSAASLGIVIGGDGYESPDQVLRDADTAMYRAKAAGKSGFVIFDDAMHQEALSRLQLETDFRLAVERSEFQLHYQPIIEIATGRLVGAEALMRWRHPVRGLLPPSEFLAVAEETGLIVDMDAWGLREACRQLADWRSRFPEHAGLTMNVNVDERQMLSPEIVEEVFSLLQSHRLAPASVRLEVTETAFRAGRGQAEQRLLSLKALGVGLVVDDFGTGYSSLESFAASPFDALKIDQVFIRDIESNPRHRAIVRTITAFADELGLALTAEGIETQGQQALLKALGCRFGQGYLF